jgi:hypothetical protein
MRMDHRAALASISRFDQLITYLRDEMGWPISQDSLEDAEDLFFDYTPDELGIDPKIAARIESIKRLRPLSPRQPWGIFFVRFEPKRLPVVALRRILSQVALKKRASANSAERAAWTTDDLLFISNYGEGDQRHISFAHFSQERADELPTLRVLGWDNLDTPLHLDQVAKDLTERLAWPADDGDAAQWRENWRAAFTLRYREVITTSKAMAVRLAHLARMIRDRITTTISIESSNGPLTQLMKAFRESLINELTIDEFADMYAQTIAYGLLSARITTPRSNSGGSGVPELPLTNPFLKELLEAFLHPGAVGTTGASSPAPDFDELGISEVVDLLDRANLEAVVRDFGDRNPDEDPVIHFYELFLKEYDAKKRMQRGVFYTPRPVVSYIVRSVDELLRTEYDLQDGLADTATWGEVVERRAGTTIPEGVQPADRFVTVLDPATGTGTFLVEAIDLIHRTLVTKWRREGKTDPEIRALWNAYVPQHLLARLHGFELLMAPFAIAHLKVGLKLHETGYAFDSDERARIYLTNSLEPASDFGQTMLEGFLPALAHEAQAVNAVKRSQRFTVVMGNPPYSISSANRGAWIEHLVTDYKRDLNQTNLNALSDDYVKFIRLTEYLATRSGGAVVGLVTNNSFLDGISYRRMRHQLLGVWNADIANLHGSVMQRDELPALSRDENIFDIQQGVAISLFAPRGPKGDSRATYVDVVGTRLAKYAGLSSSSLPPPIRLYPESPYFFLKPKDLGAQAEYFAGFPLNQAFQRFSNGISFRKENLLVKGHFTKASVVEMLRDVLQLTDAALLEKYDFAETSDWKLRDKRPLFRDWTEADIVEVQYRPFDYRFAFYPLDRANQIIVRGDSRVELMRNVLQQKNVGLQFNRQIVGNSITHFLVSRAPTVKGTFYLGNKGADCFAPLYLVDAPEATGAVLFPGGQGRSNLTVGFLRALAESLQLEVDDWGLPLGVTPEDILGYAYGVFHSPTYRSRFAEFLKLDFPRLPLTGSTTLFKSLARLGAELMGLHLLESARLDPPITEFAAQSNPEVEKVSWWKNTVWVNKAQTAGFSGVRDVVWNFRIGGSQVCEKWLKDRKGRTLSDDDIAHYQKIVVAISETIRVMGEIDEVIDTHGGWPGAFQTVEAGTELRKVAETGSPYLPNDGPIGEDQS